MKIRAAVTLAAVLAVGARLRAQEPLRCDIVSIKPTTFAEGDVG